MRTTFREGDDVRRNRVRMVLFVALTACAVLSGYLLIHRAGSVPTSEQNRALALLGSQIFNDRQFSADSSVSCASCHRPDLAFTDGLPLAIGVHGHSGTRNTPSLLTSAAHGKPSFFWDGRRDTLSVAVLDPFTNPVEMGLSHEHEVVDRANVSPRYRELTREAFGDEADLDLSRISAALTTYLGTLDAVPTAYDRYAVDNDKTALSGQALVGLSIFQGKGQCASCHSLSNQVLTDHGFHRSGVGLESVAQDLPSITAAVMKRPLRLNELGPWIATHPKEAQLGRFNVTRQVADIENFATPSLRHVSLTAPYMHDGSIPTLDSAIDREVYYRSLDTGYPIGLTVQERQDLRTFLESL